MKIDFLMDYNKTENHHEIFKTIFDTPCTPWKINNKGLNNMEKIKQATAIYSGGGIYLYYAELGNKNWIMGSDEGLIIVNTNPLVDEETYDESNYWEWQEQHLVEEITEEDYQNTLNRILEVIFDGRTIEEYNNYLTSELERRYKK